MLKGEYLIKDENTLTLIKIKRVSKCCIEVDTSKCKKGCLIGSWMTKEDFNSKYTIVEKLTKHFIFF